MDKLGLIKKTLREEGLLERKLGFEANYARATMNERIRNLLEFESVPISDLTEELKIENGGRLLAVREDLNKGADNHKKRVVGGLILRRVLEGRIPGKGIDTLIDGGNYNSAKALNYYAKLLGMKGTYVMSRLFPQNIIDLLEDDHFHVIRAPEDRQYGIEKEFYAYLFEQMRDDEFNHNKCCLWHAKYSGRATYPFGKEVASRLEGAPDYVVSCLGAGSTLEGLQIAIQDHFKELGSKKTPEIIVGEHELSPLLAKIIPYSSSSGPLQHIKEGCGKINLDDYLRVEGVPHMVIGPHYDEINPLLSKKSIARIDRIVQYSEQDWMTMQKYLSKIGLSVGNSSAANLSVAAHLANQGNSVFTVIFEPFRDFYKNLNK